MEERRRIVHVITRLDLGGAQEIALYCVRHLDRARFDVGLVAGAGGVLDDDARAIPDADVHLVPWLVHPIDPLADLDAVSRLTRLFTAMRPDVVHAHSSKAGVLARLAARAAGVPVVVYTAHGWSFNDTQRPAVRATFAAIERTLAGLTDRIYTVSERDRRRGEALGCDARRPILVVRAGIDVARFAALGAGRAATRAALGVDDDEILVGTIACLKPQKAPLDLVEVAARALAQRRDLRFVVAGDGVLRGAVEARVKALGIGDRFRLLGWRRDADALVGAFDVFLLMSRFEGLPRAVLEAMAARVPVVATAVDGIPEVVSDETTGYLVGPGDVDAASAAVLRLAGDATLRGRLAARGHARLVDDFDVARMLEQLTADYELLLDENAGR